jgi:hypothetical protein
MTILNRMNDIGFELMTETTSHKYFIGDLCYVLHDEWNEVCNLSIPDDGAEREGRLQLQDGREFFIFGTAYGDGVYTDQFYGQYPVDSGTIGAIKVDHLNPEELAEAMKGKLGVIHEFPNELQEHDAENQKGVLYFGGVVIDTAGGDDEEDDVYEWEQCLSYTGDEDDEEDA